MSDQRLQIIVVRVRLEAKLMFQGGREGDNEVQAADLAEEVFLAYLRSFMALISVNPNQAREILRRERELRPVLATFVVTLVCG
jgi:hypothetical protein